MVAEASSSRRDQVVSRYRFDNDGYGNAARRGLNERQQRAAMGEKAYERMTAQADTGAFRAFGLVFIIAFAFIVAMVTWLGW
jgi:hypothetical protein